MKILCGSILCSQRARVGLSFTLCLVALLGSAGLFAQSRQAEIIGVITDTSGAVIVGAELSIVNDATGVRVSTISNEAGFYRIQNLITGAYRVEVSSPGFKSFVGSGVVLEVGQIARVDATLEIGQVTEMVEVSAEVPLLQTETSNTDRVVLRRDMQYQPNLNRSFNSLLTRTAIFAGQSDNQYAGSNRHGTGFYINGAQQQRRDDSSPIDWNSTTDFIQEVKVLINGYSAEFKGPQAVVVETKSGTNEFHGSAYFWIRDRSLNANPWGASSQLPFRQTEPGFTLGGPIVKNKTHFFVHYQRRNIKQERPNFLTVPTLLQRDGDFSETFTSGGELIPIFDPATTSAAADGSGTQIRDRFLNNTIPLDRLDPVGSNILSFYSKPNEPGTITGALNYFTEQETISTNPQYNARIDHYWSEHSRTHGTVVGIISRTEIDSLFDNPGTSGERPSNYPTRTYTIGHTYTPKPNWVVDTNFSMLQREWSGPNNGWNLGYPEQLGLKGVVDSKAHFPNITGPFFGFAGAVGALPGYSYLGGSTWANLGSQKTAWSYSFAERLSYVTGRHTIKFGVEVLYWSHRYSIRAAPSGELGFGTQSTSQPSVSGTGNAAASLLLGLPLTGRLADVTPDRIIASRFTALYLQEDWKVTNNFTLNLGLRWEYDTGTTVRTDQTDNYLTFFDPNPINPVSGTPGVITYAGKDSFVNTTFKPSWNHFQPRVGFAWQVRPRTVIRANSGIFYRNPMGGYRISGVWELGALGLPGFVSSFWQSPDNGITHPFRLRDGFPAIISEPAGSGFGAVAVGEIPRTNVMTTVNGTEETPFAYQISNHFGIQHELPNQLLLKVGYYGLHTRHFYNWQALNQVFPSNFGPGNAQLLRPFPQYGSVDVGIARQYNQDYHGLELGAQQRFSRGLSFDVSYAFSKNLTNYSPWNAYDHHSAWQMFAPQRRFVATWVYDLPWGPGRPRLQSGPLSRILGGWTLSSYTNLVSGSYLDVSHFTDTTNGFIMGNQGVNVSGNPNTGSRTMERWFNTDVFTFPDPYTFGNAGRTLVEGPGSNSFDFALTKDTHLSERYSVEFRADFINAFNHPNLTNPNTTLGSPTFGLISSKSGNRNIQLGVRFLF